MTLSLPSRERGLKFDLGGLVGRERGVAPFTGAWIEISTTPAAISARVSLPSRERGLKSVPLVKTG